MVTLYITVSNSDEGVGIRLAKESINGCDCRSSGRKLFHLCARFGTNGSSRRSGLAWPRNLSGRGGSAEMGNRQQDIKLLYETNDWIEADTIIARYDIRYIYIGNLENSSYHVSLDKFNENTKVVYQNQTVAIYEVPEEFRRINP